MNFTLHTRALALAACFAPALLFAQTPTNPAPNVTTLDTIVATPARMAQPLDKVMGDVTVIQAESLQNAGMQSMTAILARQPGLQIYNSGGPQTLSGIYLRGASPQQSLVLVNGMRINDNLSGATNWAAIDPSTIERIEIIRGSASSLYGSNAMGGVINIITKPGGQDRPFSAFGNVGVGSDSTFKTGFGFSGAQNNWNYSLAASYASSDGFNATNPDSGPYTYNQDDDGYTQTSLTGSLGYEWNPGQRVDLTFLHGYNHGDFDSGKDYQNTYGITRQQAYTLGSTNQITANWESILSFGYSKSDYDSQASYGRSEIGTIQRQYSWQNNFTLNQNNVLSLVLEHLDERASGSSLLTRQHRDTNAVGLIYRGDFDRHHLQASVRHDNISSIGDKTTGSLGYDYDLSPSLKLGVAASTGFRAPTFADLYTPLSWGYQGNPNLKPEKSKNIEASLRYQANDTQLSLVVFQNKFRDLINPYVCDAMFNCTAENTDKATIRGLSLEASHQFGNTLFSAGADFLNPKDDTNGKTLVRRAKQVYRLSVSHKLDNAELGASYQFVGKRFDDKDNTAAKKLGGYGLLNLHASYQFNKNLQGQIYWNNVTDKKYNTAYGYNSQGSNVFLNLAWRM
ncbi:TonB-dependent receptor [Advenella sp. WQ 585]|uniref:TonB-dependent receptor n=1 Tax=Advenella mandrilli TaxID=2800330 RepID=A0ABS1EBS5_9BURK|nr:TonB-dependent receptor [Advenella mandrilli]MBK1780440.1 TonB-dependent receptor [Advenella mandrilli]